MTMHVAPHAPTPVPQSSCWDILREVMAIDEHSTLVEINTRIKVSSEMKLRMLYKYELPFQIKRKYFEYFVIHQMWGC